MNTSRIDAIRLPALCARLLVKPITMMILIVAIFHRSGAIGEDGANNTTRHVENLDESLLVAARATGSGLSTGTHRAFAFKSVSVN